MRGFVYIWRDMTRNMFYIGSHSGEPTDGYLSSSRWLNGEIRYRPNEFRRKIIKFLPLSDLKIEEYRLIGMIRDSEYGVRYYNIKSGQKQGSIPWNKGKKSIYSKETLEKMSKARLGKPTTKGIPNPSAAENGRRGAQKLSKTVTGRKRQYKEDGTWTWLYPSAND